MGGAHKDKPISYRPLAGSDIRDWLDAHSARTRMSVNRILDEALAQYRASRGGLPADSGQQDLQR